MLSTRTVIWPPLSGSRQSPPGRRPAHATGAGADDRDGALEIVDRARSPAPGRVGERRDRLIDRGERVIVEAERAIVDGEPRAAGDDPRARDHVTRAAGLLERLPRAEHRRSPFGKRAFDLDVVWCGRGDVVAGAAHRPEVLRGRTADQAASNAESCAGLSLAGGSSTPPCIVWSSAILRPLL